MQRVVQIRRERGIALALVLISLAVCVVVGVAFLSGASLSTAEAQNAHRREVAKRIADSGVDVATPKRTAAAHTPSPSKTAWTPTATAWWTATAT